MSLFDIIEQPILTEKSMLLKDIKGKYLFRVKSYANKIQIKQAIEKSFGVDVVKVNTMNVIGKNKRMGRFKGKKPDWKKAIVSIAEGQSIEYFESI